MSFAVLRKRGPGGSLPVLVAVLALTVGGCTLDFPIEWLSGECGDGRTQVGDGEQCDDGDTTSGDGCSDTCTEEQGFECSGSPSVCVSTCGDGQLASDEQCDDGNTAPGDGCDDLCNNEIVGCGDGEIQTGDGEECDDQNLTAFDGCDDQCLLEAGWNCTGAPSVCSEVCGDGSVVGAEAMSGGCDDGNLTSGDGCTLLCEVEPGYTCQNQPGEASECSAGCGDGALAGVEDCDDGNILPDDGCTSDCHVEDGWDCDNASPTVCAATCGDGTVVGPEGETGGCDDGNTDPNDGCAGDCTEESGYDCTGEPSVCDTVCGDGITAGAEACDDSNTTDCDGCHGDCMGVETGCGDGFVCGSEACDDDNNTTGDGCSSTCLVETGWTCGGEPSVCSLGCTEPQALFLQAGCPGEMCTITASTGGSYVCIPEGANPFYATCTGYQTCAAGSTCVNVGVGPQCLPYCDLNDPFWSCPNDGSELATCAIIWPAAQSISGLCAPNQCDAVDQTGCSGGWCDRYRDGVSFCSTDPQGTVPLHGACVQGSTTLSEICAPGMLCINTGTDECLQFCHLGQNECPGTETCNFWNPPDPVYGVCEP